MAAGWSAANKAPGKTTSIRQLRILTYRALIIARTSTLRRSSCAMVIPKGPLRQPIIVVGVSSGLHCFCSIPCQDWGMESGRNTQRECRSRTLWDPDGSWFKRTPEERNGCTMATVLEVKVASLGQLAGAPHPGETEMKNRTFVALLLSTAIALPAFAQEANSSSSAQPAASAAKAAPTSQSVTSTGNQPLRWTREDFWDGDEPGAVWLVLQDR